MPLQTFQIAVLPGDGIGVDVTDAGLQIVHEVARSFHTVRLEFTEHAVGAGEFLRSGNPLPAAALDACQTADAVLLGAMGLPHVRWPDGREMAPQLDLREQLDLYCGLRPVRLLHPADSPLKSQAAGAIDLLIVRENCEGLFSTRLVPRPADADVATDTLRISRRGAQRICRAAFDAARQRRRHVTLVDKANVLPSMVFFREIFDETALEYPDVRTDRIYVDAAALYLVRHPQQFDVLVTENMFGDILSDLAAGIVGGMGVAPSADVGERSAVFQPAHGSAPDIAGQGIANPVATILSAAMMLDWLAHPETREAARRIRLAIDRVFADPTQRTPDMQGQLSTQQMTECIARQLPPAAELPERLLPGPEKSP